MPYKWIYLLYIRHIYYTIKKIFHRLSRVNFQNFGKMCYIFAITKLERFAIWFMQSPKTNINPISESDGIEIIANKKIERHIRWWHHDKPEDWAWLVPGALYNLFGIFCYDRLDSSFSKTINIVTWYIIVFQFDLGQNIRSIETPMHVQCTITIA